MFNGGILFGRYRWDQSVSYLYVDVFPPRATMFTVTDLLPVTTYNFSVNALNAMGESGYADNNAVLTIATKGQFGATPARHWQDSALHHLIMNLTEVYYDYKLLPPFFVVARPEPEVLPTDGDSLLRSKSFFITLWKKKSS